MAARPQVSPKITERHNSVITKTCATSAAEAPATPIRATSNARIPETSPDLQKEQN
ncbi:hypothetical protein GCM10010129_76870 [Streptomyces fumigatiscleroticus]|nr:hypothetical protein GCM10010129_76870 [Streptomyces fumigatiscleroticus]